MTMLYLRKNKNSIQTEKKKSLVVILVIIFLIFFGQYKKEWLVHRASSITDSVHISFNEITNKIYSFFYFFYSKEKLAIENENLKKELEIKEHDLYLLYKNQNLTFKETNNSSSSVKSKGESVIGYITSRAPFIPFGYAFVNVGQKNGVRKGNLVTYNDFLVGQVYSALPENSLVKFFGYRDENRNLLIGLSRIAKTGTSNGNGAFSIEMPKDLSLKENEPVRLSEYPKYIFGETIFAGTLGSVEKNSFFAKSPVNYLEIPFVKILIK